MGAKRVEYHDEATADVKSAVAWYQKRSPKVALEFIDELSRAVDEIGKSPRRWPVRSNNTRQFLLWRFPFPIIYSEEEERIIVWAVAHGSRRPEYWTRRLDL